MHNSAMRKHFKSGLWWVRIALIVLALAILFARVGWHFYSEHRKSKPVVDLSLTSPLNQPGGGTAPTDAYAIYSALYQAPAQDPLVFSEDSVTDIPQVNGSCLQPSTPQEREMTDAFVAANRQSHRWERRFAIPQAYRLISRSDATAAQSCLDTHFQDASRCRIFRPIFYVRFLGVPGFNRAHTQALVSVIKMCGSFCGSGAIFTVEKADGKWRRAETTALTRECSWMY
jgi:hypothetical protein